jgi:hypothetical protein
MDEWEAAVVLVVVVRLRTAIGMAQRSRMPSTMVVLFLLLQIDLFDVHSPVMREAPLWKDKPGRGCTKWV